MPAAEGQTRSLPARQLDDGFASLRFSAPLEQAFRRHQLEVGMLQLRIALSLGFLFGFSFLVLDYVLGEPGFSGTGILVRTAINQSLIAAMLAATFVAACHRYLNEMAVAVCLSIAACSVFVTTVGEARDVGSSLTGFLVLTFYTYLFIGLRFWPALATAATVLLSVVVTGLLSGMPGGAIVYNGLFLLFANLIGATGLYNLEYNQRKSYLESLVLENLVRSDALTGLANRDYFAAQLRRAWAHCVREQVPLALAMIDIDHFKQFNDEYGHQAGDRCLKQVAATIGKVCRRPLDLAGRYGGEEFIVMLPGASSDHAHLKLSQLLAAIENLGIAHAGSQVAPHVTVSAGLAHLLPHETERSIAGALQMADEALYSAKRKGRNRVVVAREGREKSLETGVFHLTRNGKISQSA